jgi:DNA-directed RNA polymerase alpha subunit
MKKEILDFIGIANYQGDDLGTYIWANRPDSTRELIAVVYGYNTETEKNEGKAVAELFQDELGKFIAEAINEKIKRDTTYEDLLQSVELIDYNQLSVRLLNCLKNGEVFINGRKEKANITFITDLPNYKRQTIYAIKNFGKVCQFQLDKFMNEYGIKFKGE